MTRTVDIGFLNIDKPEGWTSHDVVAKLRRILGIKKIGHAGTLDPFATGVLPIAIGPATRLMRFLPKSKKYSAEINLLFTTDTDDLTGVKLRDTDKKDTEISFKTKLDKFRGTIDQIPPLYSAKKINGKKLYELMRAGEPLDLSQLTPKKVTIKDISLISFDYPLAVFEVACSEGTYIRSIARDLGGHLTKLRRLESNGFDIKSCVRFEDIEDGDIEMEDLLLDIKDYVKFPYLNFEQKQVVALQQGQKIYLDEEMIKKIDEQIAQNQLESGYMTCLDTSGDLVGFVSLFNNDNKHDTKKSYMQAQPLVIF